MLRILFGAEKGCGNGVESYSDGLGTTQRKFPSVEYDVWGDFLTMKLLLDVWKKQVRILFGAEKGCRDAVSTERRSGPVENPATGGRSHSDGIRRNPI